MSRLPTVALAMALAMAACAGPSLLVIGESARDPGPPIPQLVVVALSTEDGSVIPDAVIAFNGDVASLDESGAASTDWYEKTITVRAEASGFEPTRVDVEALPEEGPLTVAINPVILTGTVKTRAGVPVQGASVALNDASSVTGSDGTYRLVRASEGLMTVRRAAWESESREWSGSSSSEAFVLEPRMVRALRVTADNAGNPAIWAQFLEMAAETDVNAFVIDTKDESGTVRWGVDSPTAAAIGAVSVRFDAGQILADMKAADLYAITRIVTFQDSYLSEAFPEYAARNTATGGVWRTNRGAGWMDPTDRRSWSYPLELAVEACELGFDEIQFDYVRFPSDGPLDALDLDAGRSPDVRIATIAAFLGEARTRLNPLGCAVAADIFAITVSTSDDQGIGQRPEELSQVVDVLSPMIYPTHYTDGWDGFDEPNDHPAEVVGGALDDGLPRLVGSAIMRPWLQTSTYGATEVGLEVDEATARDLGWMLWSSTNIFDPRELDTGQ
ncbi:MAG: putative glycoside hydrolase [Acidimicrobiia bacterium]